MYNKNKNFILFKRGWTLFKLNMDSKYKKKTYFFEKFNHLFSNFSKIILVKIDNVGSNQLQKCRIALKKNSVFIFGKNTILKKILKYQKKKNPSLESLLPYLSGNVGLIFTKIEPSEVKKILSENKIPAPAKIGQVAQCDVVIPSGPTNLPPDGTSFFQALNISTKIEKGQIEIEKPIKIITKGQVVGNSEFELLKKLNIVPFSYEIQIILIYDNKFSYDPVVLEISEENIIETIESVYGSISSVSKVIYYPTLDSLNFTLKKTIANIYTVCRFLDIDIKIKSSAINKEEYYEKTLNNDILENVDEISKTSVEIKSEENEDFGFGLFD